jgi:hypothetical protein
MPPRLLLPVLAVLASLVALRGAEPAVTLRIGAGRADITPGTDVLNWVTGKPFGTVRDPLLVQALVLDDGRTRAAILRWDLTDVSESARDEVRGAVERALGIPGGNVLINASHSHSAPWSPVYRDGYRGKERDNWWSLRYMPSQNDFPPYRRWMEKLLSGSVEATRQALAAAQPATISIGRVAVNEYLYNRRPRAPGWGVAGKGLTVASNQAEWDPEVLQGGATFGPVDRTLALVSLRDAQGRPIASLYHVACHAVSIYPSFTGISADWPGPASAALSAALGGESLFLQGCCGDITPWRRGPAAVAEMAAGMAKKAQVAHQYAVRLTLSPLQVGRREVVLPLTPVARERTGVETVKTEVQAIVCGPLAFVTLPGEPLTDLGTAIRERSPYPQTLVLGYSNGMGVHYVGMPGEKARGGYEMGVAGAGTDECGGLLVDAAVQVLRDLHAQGPRGKAAPYRLGA